MAPRKGSKAKGKKSNTISVDFTGVESSGNCKEGRQVGTVLEVESRTSDSSGNDYLNWKIKGQGGNVFHTTSLQPQALWNLRSTLEACGQEVPEGPLDIDLSELIDLTMGMEIEHEVYQGKKRAVIIDLFPEEELDGDEDEEEEESDAEDDSEDESEEESEEVTYEEVMEMDKDELLELAEEMDIKVTAKAKKKLDTLREFIADKLELEPSEDESDDEDEDESDELTADDINEMDKDELLEVAEENDIKVLAKVKKSVAKLREFLIEKLELEEGDDEDEEDEEDEPKKKGSTTVKKGATVKFEDDGETLKGKVKSVNKAEGFAVVLVDGEEWEVELDDIV